MKPRLARSALLRSLDRRIRTEGEISFPAAPALLDEYMRRLAAMFVSMGKRFSRAELTALRNFLEPRLTDGFEQSPHARVHVRWWPEAPPGTGVDYRIWLEGSSIEAEYEHWVASKEPPLFGLNPDAKFLELVRTLESSGHRLRRGAGRHRILDIGTGSGRNALALARAGYGIDALETTPAFCQALRKAARKERLPLEVIESNVFAPDLTLGRAQYSLVLCSEVTSHFRGVRELRALFERAARWMRNGGSLLLNAFVAQADYEPTPLARELSQIAWSTIFTRQDLAHAVRGLSLSLVSDESVHAYEKQHQPVEGWPPTSWFESWSRGFNCYGVKRGLPPMDLRWLRYRKTASRK